uniref:CBF1-interacting co-repressor CIR N-terminal domain-containing protein n=1 Tax=Kalanchoe fedtschenkoi TaxID=63787 RepID=A0A7N0TU38_KALFE
MGMKFLNKKGWHTGSLRNIENVWKAEQKHDQEQKKLEELRKQIVEERERAEFRQLQEQAGLVPRQERLDFLYDSGLAVGKSSEGFKSLEAYPKPEESAPAQSSSAAQQSSTPGALFEEKPQSANDAWRKLHSDPLLMIRQREQEALARIKNNPVKMAMIRRSVEESKNKENSGDIKKKKKHGKKKSSHKKHSSRSRLSDEDDDNSEDSERPSNKKNEGAIYDKHYSSGVHGSDSEEEFNGRGRQISGNDSHDRDSRRYRDVSRGSDSEEEFREKFGQQKDDRGSRRKDDHDRDPRQYTDVRRDSNEYSYIMVLLISIFTKKIRKMVVD